jgi:hypothetical protein
VAPFNFRKGEGDSKSQVGVRFFEPSSKEFAVCYLLFAILNISLPLE